MISRNTLKSDKDSSYLLTIQVIATLQVGYGEIQKCMQIAQQAGNSNNKYTVNCIFIQKSRHNFTLLCESTILACLLKFRVSSYSTIRLFGLAFKTLVMINPAQVCTNLGGGGR